MLNPARSVPFALAFCAVLLETVSSEEPDPELHIVFIYEGYTKTGDQIHGERATVQVDRPGKSVVLFLGSYGSVTWTVEASAKTRIRSVILGGREKQAVKGLDDDINVVEAFGRDRRKALYGYYRIDAAPSRLLIEQLASRTGVAPSSFHGIYRPEAPIPINGVQDDPRLDSGYPRVWDEAFPKTAFRAIHYVSGRHPHERTASVGEYTLQGPKLDTLRPVRGRYGKLAFDPEAKQWFALSNSLFKLELAKGTAEELPLDIDAPRFSHPSAVVFDTKRKRVLVATSGGDGILYAYAVKEKQWSVVGNLNGLDLTTLCYSEQDDSLYSLILGYDGNSHTIPTLLRLNASGAVIDRQRIKGPFFAGMIGDGHHGGSTQLIPLGEKLVLIANSNSYDSGDGSRLEPVTYILLVDLKTMSAKLTWKSKADKVAAKFASVNRTQPNVPAPIANNAAREVHAVCLYEGVNRRTAEVLLQRPGKKVTLFLSSYHGTEWKVSVGDDTTVERVILGGYEQQKVTGLPTSVNVTATDQRQLFGGHRIEQPRFRQVIKALHERTGMELSSCQTAYRPSGRFVIDEVASDPLLNSDYPRPVAAGQLPEMAFIAPYASGGGRYGRGSINWGEFTQAGPKVSTLKSGPKGISRLAYDPKRKQFYGLGGDGVSMVDMESGVATKMDLGMDVPRLSWPSALTFDSKRRRLLLFASGLIYQCDVDNDQEWTVLCELSRGSQIHAAAYSPSEDAIVIVGESHGGEGQPTLTLLNAEGASTRTSQLKRPVLAGMFGRGPGSNTHLIAVKDQLVLLVYPHSHDPEVSKSDAYMFIINPKTGNVKLAWKK